MHGMGGAGHTIFALVQIDVARCPLRLDFLLRVVEALYPLAVAAIRMHVSTHCEIASARLERDQRLYRHGGGACV
jgi:hypothetical protein